MVYPQQKTGFPLDFSTPACQYVDMRCIYCGEKTRTANSRSNSGGFRTWRRRKCNTCGAVFTTHETADMESSMRVNKDSSLEPFVYEKLFLDVYDALSHRKTAYTDAGQLESTIVAKLIPQKNGVIEAAEIKEAALAVLKRFDKTAYTHYKARH